jgi:F420H(2)-dependent quinone reductase
MPSGIPFQPGRHAPPSGAGVNRGVARPYSGHMALAGEYEPSPSEWVSNQVAQYEASGGAEGNTLLDTGMPVIIVTTRGNKSGKVRKTPLMRVEHDGEYALVASKGGDPKHPVWYYNLLGDPGAVVIQDGPVPFEVMVREASGDEKREWWDRAVAAYPPYADYQAKTDRQIPLFIATPKGR